MVNQFTLEEAEELLPEVAFLMDEAMSVDHELKDEYSKAVSIQRVAAGSSSVLTQEYTEQNKKQIRVLNEELNDILEEIEDLGAILKDLEEGIIDFPGKFEGRRIFFCWELGQDRITYWHEEHESSYNRKRIIRLGR